MKKLLIAAAALLTSNVFASSEPVEVKLFSWASAGLPVSFPQTYVINKDASVVFSKLDFGSETEYLNAWKGQTKQADLNIEAIKQSFPELYKSIEGKWANNEQVVITVGVNKSVTDCAPCTQQSDVLAKQNYFELPHIEVMLTK